MDDNADGLPIAPCGLHHLGRPYVLLFHIPLADDGVVVVPAVAALTVGHLGHGEVPVVVDPQLEAGPRGGSRLGWAPVAHVGPVRGVHVGGGGQAVAPQPEVGAVAGKNLQLGIKVLLHHQDRPFSFQ